MPLTPTHPATVMPPNVTPFCTGNPLA